MAENYYSTLGVERTATQEEIQKAYRKLARKHHPDLHADKDDKERERAKQKFQKVQQAYDILGEPEKRRMYDQFGEGFEQMRGASPGGGPFGGGPFGSSPYGTGTPFGAGPSGQPNGPSYEEFLRQMGAGAPGQGPPRGGLGGFEDLLRKMGGFGAGRETAPVANAQGEDIETEITISFGVSVLGGTHQVSFQRRSGKVETIEVKIPSGIEQDKKIRLRGQGFPNPSGGPPGDLMVKVKVAPHPSYTRTGLNLNVTVPISVKEAVAGAKILLKTPHGKISVSVPEGSSSGKSLRLRGMGIRTKDRSGDLIATLQIMIPKSVPADDLKLLEQLSGNWLPPDRDCDW